MYLRAMQLADEKVRKAERIADRQVKLMNYIHMYEVGVVDLFFAVGNIDAPWDKQTVSLRPARAGPSIVSPYEF